MELVDPYAFDYTPPANYTPFWFKASSHKAGFEDSDLSAAASGYSQMSPLADLIADVTSGDAPLGVNFDAIASSDPDGFIAKYEWDWEADGIWDLDSGTTPTADHTYLITGEFDATVRVTDDEGATDTDTVTITVT